ncbi:hypothetical protein ACFL3V_06255 [Nanoarchaeota archaeon]
MKKTILAGMMVVVSLFLIGCGGGPAKDYNGFAECLTGAGVVMYGSELCPHCMNVKKDFGNAFKHITYVECNANMPGGDPEKCAEEGVQYLPTFKFGDGQKLVGELEFSLLAQKTGCELPE